MFTLFCSLNNSLARLLLLKFMCWLSILRWYIDWHIFLASFSHSKFWCFGWTISHVRLLVVDRLFMESSLLATGWLASKQINIQRGYLSRIYFQQQAAASFRIKWIVTNANAGKCCGWPKSTLVCVYACRIHRCIIFSTLALVVSISDSSSSKASRFNYILATWLEGTSAATSTYLLSAN